VVYIRLFHGRIDPEQNMDDWGSDGQVFGPYNFAHTTYSSMLKLGRADGNCDQLHITGPDMIYYNGVYYGDWSIFDEVIFKEARFQVAHFEQSKAELPNSVNS